jgi:carboxypeptidase PM20D1
MSENRTESYASKLSRMIRMETVSTEDQKDKTKFYRFRELLRELFPHIFSVCELEDFDGSFLMRWEGEGKGEPILFMNHHDVVDASGKWIYEPFAGVVAEGKVWGRGALDTKGGLWAMLEAADELAEKGYRPGMDIYFMSTCNEECDGAGADRISRALKSRGIHFRLVLDEGGMILEEPMDGAKGTFAIVGIGEKGCADLKFIARSSGGHASTPGRNTPLVRLGKFMRETERANLFKAEISPAVAATFAKLASSMRGPMKYLLGHSRFFAPLLKRVIPNVSNTAGAMLKTTIAFTMAGGSEGMNVLPHEAWVIGNMRYSHYEGREKSFRTIIRLAKKYGIETVILNPGFDSVLSDHRSEEFRSIERAVAAVFDETVRTTPYVMTAASDSRYLSRVCPNCFRFTPFCITQAQLDSIHGINENVDIAALAPAVEFYQYMMTEV